MENILKWTRSELIFFCSVVIVIFGISYYQLKLSEIKTRDAQRKADVELVARALDRYFEDFKRYPPTDTEGNIVSCGKEALEACKWGNDRIVDIDGVVYLTAIPKDPQAETGKRYVYSTNKDLTHIKIYINLENKGDPAYKTNLDRECGKDFKCNWYVDGKY